MGWARYIHRKMIGSAARNRLLCGTVQGGLGIRRERPATPCGAKVQAIRLDWISGRCFDVQPLSAVPELLE